MNTCAYRATFCVFCLSTFGLFCGIALGEDEKLAIGLDGKICTFEEAIYALHGYESQFVNDTTFPAKLTLEQLRQGIETAIDNVTAIEIRYTYSIQRRFTTSLELQAEQNRKLTPANFSLRVHGALKDVRYRIDSEEITGGVNKRHTISVFDGKVSLSFQPNDLSGGIVATREPKATELLRDYTSPLSLPICLGEEQSEFERSPLYLPYLLIFSDVFSVDSTLDDVDGHLCHVVSMGPDTVWIDSDEGFCVRRRVMFDKTQKSAITPYCLSYLLCAQEHKKVIDNVYLPLKLSQYQFGTENEPEEKQGKLAQSSLIKVDLLSVADIDEKLFSVSFPPGTRVMDMTRNAVYYMPNGEEELDKAIAAGARIVNGEVVGGRGMFNAKPSNMPPIRRDLHFIWYFNIVIIISIIGYMLISRRCSKPDLNGSKKNFEL